jgi:fructuronate reductase
MTADRLSAATRPDLVPPYDRTAPPRIAHLGVGAFARAHLGAYADDLLRAGWPATIRGVSLRSPAAEEQLAPQDGLYAVLERSPEHDEPPRVLGAITVVATGPDAAVAAIADPTTTLVTLTVTEKAYAPDEVPAVLAAGLARRDRFVAAPVVASLDNLADNGELLRRQVLGAAEGIDAGLGRWIADEVRFPSSVVDRMVPATTPADRDEVEHHLGCRDEAAVVAEPHCSWVVEAVDGLPPLADVGVDVVGDVGPYQRRKLWLLNGPHSALAYAGLLAGCETIAEAAEHPVVAPFVRRLVDDVLEVADVPDAKDFAADALRRFRNPALGHGCRQVGADGSQKLPQRILPVVAARRRRGLPTTRLAVVVAACEWSALDDAVAIADPGFRAEVEATLEDLRQRNVDVLREAV